MQKLLSLPVAWCVELKKQVTSEDILQYRHKHPDQKLSFLCPECRLPITFQPWIQGIVAQGYFKRRSGQNHQACLHKLKQETPASKEAERFNNFEESFVDAQEAFSNLKDELTYCYRLYLKLIEEIHPQLSLKQAKAFQSIETSFKPLKEVYLTLETFLKKTEADYVSSRVDFKGY